MPCCAVDMFVSPHLTAGGGAYLVEINLKGSEGTQLEERDGEDGVGALTEVGKIRVKEAISLVSTQCGPSPGSW